MISLCINTCAGREQEWVIHPDGPYKADPVLAHSGQAYEPRAYALQNFILPAAIADPDIDEVIVVGEWHDGEGYTYVPAPSVHFSSDDAPHQRQAAFEAAKGDWLVFQHDDHMLENPAWHDSFWGHRESELGCIVAEEAGPGILIPQRWTRLRNVAGERLPNGETVDGREVVAYNTDGTPCKICGSAKVPHYGAIQNFGYISGHCAIYRREVLEACPWANVPAIRTWDIAHTEMILEAGFNIHWSDSLRCYDVEMGSQPWL